MAKPSNHKIIFGLKVRQLRMSKGIKPSDLSEATGVSVSYLNEIEKGKKYPKIDKIKNLAIALETSAEELSSPELRDGLAPIAALLESNFLNDLPLDLFGIELSKVVDIIANAPLKVGAFISTLVELSRTYAVQEENFYFRALRSYQELHNNYFEDIETEADRFIKMYDIPIGEAVPPDLLATILKERFGYKIINNGLDKYPELERFRSVFIPKKKQLLLNSKLNDMQRAFQLAKELGFSFLRLKERPYTSSLHKIDSFEEVLNNYKAGYFAVAILVNREAIIRDLTWMFNQSTWNPNYLQQLTEKYQASATVLFQRFNVLPKYFGLNNNFFIRFFHKVKEDSFVVDKELHLNRKHQPHSNGLREHYCRRWLSIASLNKLASQDKSDALSTPIFGIQKERYEGTKDEYLCITISRPSYPSPHRNMSVTLGILLNEKARATIKFLDDPVILTRQVNVTCERCSIKDCKERVVAPIVIEKKARNQNTIDRLNKILK